MPDYMREVAFELRKRGLSEREVAEKITELAALPEPQALGTPAQVALSVPAGKHRSAGFWVLRVGIVIMVVAMGWFLYVQIVAAKPVSVAALVVPTLVLVASIAAAAYLDHRLPRQAAPGQRAGN